MSTDESYNGWTNRETWAVALYINNDQQWQESVLEALREGVQPKVDHYPAHVAGEIVRENVEAIFDIEAVLGLGINGAQLRDLWMARDDIGSLWRVNWGELGAAFLEDLKDVDGS